MAQLNTYESVATAESVYYLAGEPQHYWTHYQRLILERKHCSPNKRTNISSKGVAAPPIKHLHSADDFSKQERLSVLKARDTNYRLRDTSEEMVNKCKSIKSTKSVQPKKEDKSTPRKQQEKVAKPILFQSPQPTPVRKSNTPKPGIPSIPAVWPTLTEKKPLSIITVPQIGSVPLPSKLLFSKIDMTSPSFSNILDEFQTQRSSQKNFLKDPHQQFQIKEAKEEQDSSPDCGRVRGYSPAKINQELDAIYRGCFKISKK